MRRSGIAAVLGGAGLTLVCATALTIWAHDRATADETSPDDEIITTGPTELPSFVSGEAAPIAATASVAGADAPPAPVEWVQESVRELDAAAKPALQKAETLAARYEPRLSVRMNADAAPQSTESRRRTEVALALDSPAEPSSLGARMEQRLDKLATRMGVAEDFGQKPRWFLFAASDNQAVGLNMLRGRGGELKRAGFSSEKVAAIGDAQVGVGWRKGPLQAAVSFIDRKVSAWGERANERFVAFTVSIKPTRQKSARQPQPAPRAPAARAPDARAAAPGTEGPVYPAS